MIAHSQSTRIAKPGQSDSSIGCCLLQRKCDKCRKKRQPLQRSAPKDSSLEEAPNSAPPIVHDVLRSPGAPLDPSTRAFMEPRFGHDFSNVSVHTDARAAESAREVNARAYTVEKHVVFGARQYEPKTIAGQRLLAHELMHVVQQGSLDAIPGEVKIGSSDDEFERKADKVAASILTASPTVSPVLTGNAIQSVGENATQFARLQRTIGDGHDLQSPRFAGDQVLEACFDNERLLRIGDRGTSVAKVQQALIDADFPLPEFGADGIFGSETKTAVENFQRASGLTDRNVDGVIGPTTMGLLDKRFLAGPPQPVNQCPDQSNINTDQDPLPDVPPFSFSFMSQPELLEKIKKIQAPGQPIPKTPLAATQPSFSAVPVTVKSLPLSGSNCVKCIAEWNLPVSFQAFIAFGSFTLDEPKRFAAIQQGDASGCPSSPIPRLLDVGEVILQEAVPFLVAGEFEHYLDFVRAFRIAGGRFFANVRRLTPERTHLRAKDQSECEDKVQEFLIVALGRLLGFTLPFLPNYTRTFVPHFESLYNSPDRDRNNGPHAAVPQPPSNKPPQFPNIDLAINPFGCNAFCRKLDARSFPGIPGGASDVLVKDTNIPEKKAWHVM